jgi:hypothetical protein
MKCLSSPIFVPLLRRLTAASEFARIRPTLLILLFACAAFASPCSAGVLRQPNPQEQAALTSFLQNYVGLPTEENRATRYSAAFVHLRNNESREVLVYLTSDGWCGSGGCTMLVLASDRLSYKLITKTAITRLPIRVLPTKSNGWHDISVWVQGGGIQPGYEAELSFDGKTYPGNPSVSPARRLTGGTPGQVALPRNAEDKVLY